MSKVLGSGKKVRENALKRQIKHCSDCKHSYDWHSKAHDGHLILCRCPFKQQGGKYCIFLSDPACERFVMRE